MQEAQRLAALVVERVMSGATLTVSLETVAGPQLTGGRRALVQELAYGTLRHWGRLRALVAALVQRPLPDTALRPLLAVALYQLEHLRAPEFAVVDHAVEAAAALARPAAKPLVNAVLRRYLREREKLDAMLADDAEARWSYPRWWIERVGREYPDKWQEILEAGNARPPLTLRANVLVSTRDALAARFRDAGIDATPTGAAGLLMATPQALKELPGFAEGAFSVQDAGAQLAAPLLGVRDGMRVLDACAAPGGKSTHLLELADIDLVAVDVSDARLNRLRDNVARLGLARRRIEIRAADASTPASWWNGVPFERILADVPCTASGVVRRHPDVKWLRRSSDVAAVGLQQARMLDVLWPLLARGGVFLYATCALFDEENEQQIRRFLERTPDALRETLTLPSEVSRCGGQLLPVLPGAVHNQDGFFYALLRKA